jgi:uncharacterized protein with HEPN domain
VSLSPHEYIRHILDEIEYILTQISTTDLDNFLQNATFKRAFVRSLEIIGEASKKIPDDIKALRTDIEWRKITGMRDRLIHDYFGVDYYLVWDVATTKLPDLHEKLQHLLVKVTKKSEQL